MADEHGGSEVLEQLGDELQLQAWLAGAELRHPSLHAGEGRRQVDLLVQLRDELRLQLHLGHLEAREAFERLEERWRRLKRLTALAASDEDEVHELLREIRDGYQQLLVGYG